MERFRNEHDKSYYTRPDCLILDKVPKSNGGSGFIECTEHGQKLVCKLSDYGYYSFEQIPDPDFHLCEHLQQYKNFADEHKDICLHVEGYKESIECQKCHITVSWPEFQEILYT